MAKYYVKFVLRFASKTIALQNIKTSESSNWSSEAALCFKVIKAEFTESFLAVSDFFRPIKLETDASESAIAGVLMQDGPSIAVGSRKSY